MFGLYFTSFTIFMSLFFFEIFHFRSEIKKKRRRKKQQNRTERRMKIQLLCVCWVEWLSQPEVIDNHKVVETKLEDTFTFIEWNKRNSNGFFLLLLLFSRNQPTYFVLFHSKPVLGWGKNTYSYIHILDLLIFSLVCAQLIEPLYYRIYNPKNILFYSRCNLSAVLFLFYLKSFTDFQKLRLFNASHTWIWRIELR